MKKLIPIKCSLLTAFIIITFGFSLGGRNLTDQIPQTKFKSQLVEASDNNNTNYEYRLDNHTNHSKENQTKADINKIYNIAKEYFKESTTHKGAPFVELFEKNPDESSEEYLYRLTDFDYQNWLKNLGYFDLLSAQTEFYTIESLVVHKN